MSDRPYVLLKCAMSLDGYIDTAGPTRLILSNEQDLDRVDAVRAACDAILVGANTIRRDNPRLMVRSEARREARTAAGLSVTPVKVTVSRGGDLDPTAAFFTTGNVEKIVYCETSAIDKQRENLGSVATVVDGGEPLSFPRVLADLAGRGIGRLLVEGGSSVHTALLTADLADELHLVVAPFFVGEADAPRFVNPGAFSWTSTSRARLAEVRQVGDVLFQRYALSDRFAPID
ncbi:RibD family protein [Verrucosispora sp. TAA-831]|uniref:RibD family protein n=1 Tax=Verrucosispora sp. TAA-831 TaxID=3422227 RepID=UPI003D6F215D